MKKKIALVTGGYSKEAEISYQSLITVNNNIDREKFDVYVIDITPEGWFFTNDDEEKIPVDKNDFSLTVNESNKINFDGVLICIHGTPGEDGKLQGYFDCIGLPYTTCDAATSALTFNKRYTVAVAAFANIKTSKSLHIFRNAVTRPADILQHLKLPVFVKPNNGGSSIGMSKVSDENELSSALQKALREDDQVLIEEFIKGREFTIGVFKTKGKIVTLPITEIKSQKDFFDFEAKYKGLSEEITPAEIAESIAEKIKHTALKIYALLNCRGIVRIDFIYNEEKNEPFMLEVNTVPGQSTASIIPQQVKANGWTLKQFYTALIEECWN